MNKKYFKRCELKINNGSVVIYYFHVNHCRYPTGITISNKFDRNDRYIDWDYKTNFLKPHVEDYKNKSEKLMELTNRVNNIIESKYKEEEIILTGRELKELLDRKYEVKQIVKSQTIIEHYDEFYETKKKTFKNKPQSLKDYTSLKHLLVEFEWICNKKILIRNFNDIFLEELLDFMRIEHPPEINVNGEIHKLKTKGKMVRDTIRKRLDCLSEFNRYLIKNDIISPSDFIRLKRKEIKIPPKNKVTLTIKEVQELYKMNFNNKLLNETRDLFIFICVSGLRWSDVELFDHRFIKKYNDEEWIYEFTPQKTEDSSSVDVFIPLCKMARDILLKYDYRLNDIIRTNQNFNNTLKVVCQKSDLFNDITRTKNKETGTYMYRYDLITAHKGRDTFITNLIETTPINELMKYTGHTKVSTLMKYVDKSRKVKSEYVKIFDL